MQGGTTHKKDSWHKEAKPIENGKGWQNTLPSQWQKRIEIESN
jgi:hypothetical protein